MAEIFLTLNLILTTPQTWSYDYDGNTYLIECDIAHLNEASFITVDGEEIFIADLTK